MWTELMGERYNYLNEMEKKKYSPEISVLDELWNNISNLHFIQQKKKE